ncbi:monoamine oxidase [Kitasatospora sp. GP30]|uniref:FAD-dependent oxidoreductase n=1 Tax=Kitasatospora sp. GP30 TaxID=3035084 RepID=UPI0015D65732|nr:FAD-dependent oxidoreductase [Kitasatospora sp. GP30]MDH6142731.1 monoamine oxidase [Kitasatospora sp. GP30]
MRAGRQVTVIGTGTAGLVTAAELECHGCQVEILEADHRIGGRIPTCRFHPGSDTLSVKSGAMRISEHHRQTLARIEQLRLGDRLPESSTWPPNPGAALRPPGGRCPPSRTQRPSR